MTKTMRLGLAAGVAAAMVACGGADTTADLFDGGQNDAAVNDTGTGNDGSVIDSGLTCTAPMANCSGKAADGCNVDTSKDNQNCGGCGVVCNTQCTNGVCPLFGADAGAPQQVGDFACLTVDATNVYWGTGLTGLAGSVWKVPVNGGVPVSMVNNQERPHGMASDGTDLYYANFGTQPTNGSIQKIPIGGGSPTPIAQNQANPLDVVVDANNVYWTNRGDGSVWKSSKTSPNPIKIANGAGQNRALRLRVDATNAYFTDGAGGAIRRVPLDGSQPVPATVTTAPNPGFIAIDKTTAYFGSGSGNAGALLSIPLNANNGPANQILPNQGPVRGVATDGTNVWYAIGSTGGQPNSGSLNRATIAGQTPTPLAKTQNYPGCVAIDGKSLYWINEGGGQVSKTAK